VGKLRPFFCSKCCQKGNPLRSQLFATSRLESLKLSTDRYLYPQ
jgi:hypothetical protein